MKTRIGCALVFSVCCSCGDGTKATRDAGFPNADVSPGLDVTGPGIDSGTPAPDAEWDGGPSNTLSVVQTEIGAVAGAEVVTTVGPAGGILTSSDGRVVVTFPPGAVAVDTPISLTPVSNTFPSGVGLAYRLEPSNVTFAQPVSIAFAVVASDLAFTSLGGLEVAWQTPEGTWKPVDALSRDEATNTITAQVSHFCVLGILKGVRFFPNELEVNINNRRDLFIHHCGGPKNSRGLYRCAILTEEVLLDKGISIYDLAVNSIPRGNDEVGLVSGAGVPFYWAPRRVPQRPTVMVTARVRVPEGTYGEGAMDAWIVANIKVLDDQNLTGSFDMTYRPSETQAAYASQQTFTVSARDLSIRLIDKSATEANYQMTGQVKISPTAFKLGDEVTCSVVNIQQDLSPTSLKIVQDKTVGDGSYLRWIVATDWIYSCPIPFSPPVEIPVTVMFGTGSGRGCLEPPGYWNISQTEFWGTDVSSDCLGMGRTVMSFDFHTPEPPKP